ncbi:alpha/beta fold hydrolase [Pseudochryseolinea flava]|uniref:AB hydrolase-1 domain-containing protein n=1 Tax=Pseudochryseolinea flava TaxID=2059302 RepID=A0A364XWD5_9BACT|nr:alpha/beta hydrolase [Pseudochryseolinea flava]RAV98034.1 hypothetical protein DQQ10_25870 [Pseudochryseolinea flava]
MLRALIACVALIFFGCTKKASDRYVSLNGRDQHIVELGSGEPVVVFVSGFGDGLDAFDKLQREVSKVTRTISYDRAGLGNSALMGKDRSLDSLVFELNEILQRDNISGPYILVGHSYGCHISRYFAHVYPENVAGIVLLDPGIEDLDDEIRRMKTAEEIKSYDSLYEFGRDPDWPEGKKREAHYFRSNEALLKRKQVKFSGDIPTTVITAVNMPESTLPFLKGVSQMKIALHKRWKATFPHIKHVLAENSGHYVHHDETTLVVDEIKKVITATRD